MQYSNTSSGGLAHCPSEVQVFAEKIKRIHGDVRIVREASGWHVYCASPICLDRNGVVELSKKHLAINAEKFLGVGRFARVRGSGKNDKVARCMKTGTNYRVSELFRMKPLDQRGIATRDTEHRVTQTDTSKSLVPDGKGNMIPDVPGHCVPLGVLAPEHPAIMYLTSRNYVVSDLEAQFAAQYCLIEQPESADKGRFYKRFSAGFRDTPQSRIILYGYVMGVRKIWQARYIEIAQNGYKYVLHPYKNEMVPVSMKTDTGWTPLPGFEKEYFDPAKYKTAFGAKRNETVMGFDAAVAWNAKQGRSKADSVVFVTEGPLDAARIFPFGPAVAVLGKHMSHTQASLLCSKFGKFVLVGQNDAASKVEAVPKWIAALSEFTGNIKRFSVPEDVKDVGDLTPDRVRPMVEEYMK